MEYEKVEEAEVYKTACENVKKIAKAIKAIKIKYYLNFSKISEADKKIYDELQIQMNQIAEKNGIVFLKDELMKDMEKYDEKKPEDIREPNPNDPNEIKEFLEAIHSDYDGTMEIEQQYLAKGDIGRARKCQKIRNRYEDTMDKYEKDGRYITDKRKRLESLGKNKEEIENTHTRMMEFCKKCKESIDAMQIKEGQENCAMATKEMEKEEKETEEIIQ